MVQVELWDQFSAKAEELCRGSPLDTRYTVKYNHKDGQMVLKITNNVEVRKRNNSKLIQNENEPAHTHTHTKKKGRAKKEEREREKKKKKKKKNSN